MNAQEIQAAKALEEYIDGHNFKHFQGKELTPYWDRTRGGIKNTVPPHNLWPKFIPTLRVLDELRKRLGVPITFTSTYRSPAYNRAVAGAGGSYHMEFRAADVQPVGISVSKLYEAAKALRTSGYFRGGIGKYPNFVHIDTRGYNADW